MEISHRRSAHRAIFGRCGIVWRSESTSKKGESNMIVAPARMLSAMPVKTDRLPRVTTKLGTRPKTVIAPLNAPSAAPSKAPNGMASGAEISSLEHASDQRPSSCRRAARRRPTERSMLPIRMTNVAPSEAISSVAASPVVAAKLRQVKNAGEAKEKIATSATKTPTGSQVPRSVRLGGNSVKDARPVGVIDDLVELLMFMLAPRHAAAEACAGSDRVRSVCRPAARGSPRRLRRAA